MTRQLDLFGFSEAAIEFTATHDDAELLAVVMHATTIKAAALIREFGSLAETMTAPIARLIAAGADAASIARLKATHAAIARVLRGEITTRPILNSWSAVLDYLRAVMAFADREQFRILFLDKRNHLLADEVQQTGTVDHVPVYPREIARRALELNATALLLVHNHPSGDPTPSHGDVTMTRTIKEALQPLGIALHDHVVIGKDGHASMKTMGLI